MPGRLDNLSFYLVDGAPAGDDRPTAISTQPGDLELVDPWFLLAYFSPGFRSWVDRPVAGPLSSGTAEPIIERAMGGLLDSGEPRDIVHPPEIVTRIAGELETLEMGGPPQDDPSVILNLFEDLASDLDGTDSDLDSGGGREALGAWVAAQVEAIRGVYRQAAHAGQGVDIRWHPNP
jgi:hypothetical protein